MSKTILLMRKANKKRLQPRGQPKNAGQFASYEMAIKATVDDVKETMKTHKKGEEIPYIVTPIGKVDNWVAANVEKKTGKNVKESRHILTNQFVVHIFNNHGAGNEKDPANIPINDSDFEKIPEILKNPDITVFGVKRKTKNGIKDIVIYLKNDNGTTLYFEEILKKDLRSTTFFKRKNIVDDKKISSILKSNIMNDTSNMEIVMRTGGKPSYGANTKVYPTAATSAIPADTINITHSLKKSIAWYRAKRELQRLVNKTGACA